MGNDERHRDTRRAVQQEGGAPGRETPWEGSKGFLRALIQSTSDIVVVLDAKGTVRYENSAAERVLGYRPEERIGTSAFDHVHADDLEKVREEFARTLAKPGINPPMRFRMRHADGSWRHIETVRNNLLDDPVIRGIVNVSRDVTEREEVLETLQRSKAEFQAIFDRSAVGMALVDKEGRLKESNSALQTMLGYGAEELQMMRFGDVTHPDDVAVDIEHFEKMMAGELDHFRLEKRYIRKDGSLIWGHLTSSVIHGERESPRLMVGMVEDITERRRAEEKLQASEAELKALFEAMSDIVLVLDPDGCCLRVASANPSMLYRPAQEQIGKTLHETLPPGKADLLLDHVRRALDTGRTASVEYSLTMEDRESKAAGERGSDDEAEPEERAREGEANGPRRGGGTGAGGGPRSIRGQRQSVHPGQGREHRHEGYGADRKRGLRGGPQGHQPQWRTGVGSASEHRRGAHEGQFQYQSRQPQRRSARRPGLFSVRAHEHQLVREE